MSKRQKIGERMKIDALLYRFDIACDWCGTLFLAGDALRWDHWTPLGLGGEHNFTNLQPLHVKCHDEKTRGTGATTAGSDIGKISKEKRIVRTGKFVVNKELSGGVEGHADTMKHRAVSMVSPGSQTEPSREVAQGSAKLVATGGRYGAGIKPGPLKPKRKIRSRPFQSRRDYLARKAWNETHKEKTNGS